MWGYLPHVKPIKIPSDFGGTHVMTWKIMVELVPNHHLQSRTEILKVGLENGQNRRVSMGKSNAKLLKTVVPLKNPSSKPGKTHPFHGNPRDIFGATDPDARSAQLEPGVPLLQLASRPLHRDPP